MGLITLPDKSQVNITPQNYAEVARRALSIYRERGINVDEAATNQAFLEAAGRDTAFQGAMTGPGSVDFNRLGAVAANNDVQSNLFVNASDAAFNLAPAPVQSVWQGASDGVVTATDKTIAAAKAAAQSAADAAKGILPHLPGFLSGLNTTVQLALVGGTVLAVVGGAVYLTFKFKR